MSTAACKYLGGLFTASILLVASCSAQDQSPTTSSTPSIRKPLPPPPPPDQGEIDKFLHCKAKPRRQISEREACQIKKLTARCTATDDCLVSCITSPSGFKEGGACNHTCFFGLHRSETRPSGWNECDVLSRHEHEAVQ